MRALPEGMQEALDCGATHLARAWEIRRADGSVLGFTDHDRVLDFAGVRFEPESGFTPSAIEAGTGLAADTHEVAGALSSDRITEEDILRGLYDRAEVKLWLVDWSDVARRVVLSRGLIGEVRRGEVAFEAEITGLSDLLSQPVGRAYVHSCPCRLGDAKCGVDAEAFTGAGSVVSVTDGRRFAAAGLGAVEAGWYTGGVLRWTSGRNEGLEGQVKVHAGAGASVVLELWLSPVFPVVAGDAFTVVAGCDKTMGTCGSKFDNLLNYRGFPQMPGDDVVAGYAGRGGRHDGSSLLAG